MKWSNVGIAMMILAFVDTSTLTGTETVMFFIGWVVSVIGAIK